MDWEALLFEESLGQRRDEQHIHKDADHTFKDGPTSRDIIEILIKEPSAHHVLNAEDTGVISSKRFKSAEMIEECKDEQDTYIAQECSTETIAIASEHGQQQ